MDARSHAFRVFQAHAEGTRKVLEDAQASNVSLRVELCELEERLQQVKDRLRVSEVKETELCRQYEQDKASSIIHSGVRNV